MNRYDSYCGIYCGACEVMNAKSDEEKARVMNLYDNQPGWPHPTPEQIHCSGCKTDDVFVNCSKCPFRSCAKSKEVEFCIECDEFPCEPYNQLETAAGQMPLLMHLKANTRNQEYIKANGVDKWLADQETKWKCPSCGVSFSWYAEECTSCKYSLKGIKDYDTNL